MVPSPGEVCTGGLWISLEDDVLCRASNAHCFPHSLLLCPVAVLMAVGRVEPCESLFLLYFICKPTAALLWCIMPVLP